MPMPPHYKELLSAETSIQDPASSIGDILDVASSAADRASALRRLRYLVVALSRLPSARQETDVVWQLAITVRHFRQLRSRAARAATAASGNFSKAHDKRVLPAQPRPRGKRVGTEEE
ncbi:hypothetical protein NDU88_004823 [Pleurodeles waltl]|uniref:Uncharacterized protein n=1 Tax=Pleurodeles waltl TaxID=8319 RepID=A0AAV7MB06_PLEWA|nr:hypothetical protein NDU88_004823 [Pleurodeles waltl]